MRSLLVDLNNFSRYPTIPIGLLAAILRQRDQEVEVFSPLSVGAIGVVREPPTPVWGALEARARHWSATTPNRLIRGLRSNLTEWSQPLGGANNRSVLRAFDKVLSSSRPDVVLVSSYLYYKDLCRDLVRRCHAAGVPILIGGGYFSPPEVVAAWSEIGADAIVGGEVEPYLDTLVRRAAERKPLDGFPGVTPAGDPPNLTAPPLKNLDSLPFPDYSDFPWHLYPNRITPILTGRGCGWGVCRFCSDVTSSMGRSFRSRSPENVLEELEEQSERQVSRNFVFTDLKLNSHPAMWEALASQLPDRIPGAQWIAAVHVDRQNPELLSPKTLVEMRRAGLVRLTTGLESGSQRVLDRLAKGTDVGRLSSFLHAAADAGISARATMIVGSPGEEAEDVLATARFIEDHTHLLDRVSLNRYQLIIGTPDYRQWQRNPERFPGFSMETPDRALVRFEPEQSTPRDYRRALWKVFDAVHRINRKPLAEKARNFEGVM